MVGDWLPDDPKFETERSVPRLRPVPHCRGADGFDNRRRLPDVVITPVVDDDRVVRSSSHPHIAQGSAQEVKRRVN